MENEIYKYQEEFILTDNTHYIAIAPHNASLSQPTELVYSILNISIYDGAKLEFGIVAKTDPIDWNKISSNEDGTITGTGSNFFTIVPNLFSFFRVIDAGPLTQIHLEITYNGLKSSLKINKNCYE